ncbi:ATP dependent helicase [Mycena venus]|uniref:ATP dependent helicase n=1 Tax=Mycena venus TaxID=2733690 RepID=A0A8H7CN78_9AGAR|nr:ATP dependent helicase [Mycena venus]
MLNIFETWLNRSGCCPVSVEINEYVAPSRFPDIISAIVPRRACFEHLYACLDEVSCLLFDGEMPLLRHLDLELGIPVPFTLLDVPQLRTVVLDDIAADSVTLPWGQLTSLTLRVVEPRLCFPILEKTASLVHCVLKLWPDDEPFDHLGSISLPCLKSMVLRNLSDDREVTDFKLTTFILPALLRLEIPEKFLGSNPINFLASFISTSGCKLQKMRITGRTTGSSSSEDSYLAAYPLIPSVSFEYEGEPSDDESDSDSG